MDDGLFLVAEIQFKCPLFLDGGIKGRSGGTVGQSLIFSSNQVESSWIEAMKLFIIVSILAVAAAARERPVGVHKSMGGRPLTPFIRSRKSPVDFPLHEGNLR